MNKKFKEIIERVHGLKDFEFPFFGSRISIPALINLNERIEKIAENQERIITILEGMGKEM